MGYLLFVESILTDQMALSLLLGAPLLAKFGARIFNIWPLPDIVDASDSRDVLFALSQLADYIVQSFDALILFGDCLFDSLFVLNEFLLVLHLQFL